MSKKNKKILAMEQIPVHFTTKDISLATEFREYIQNHLNALRRIFQNTQEAEVEVYKERGQYVVEVTLKVARYLLRAQERAPSIRIAFSQAMNKIDRQLHRYKERLIDRRRHSKSIVSVTVPTEISSPNFESDGPKSIISRVKQFPVKPMAVSEAVMQMDLLGHDFFVFVNAETGKVNVLYRRKAGDLGLLEPGDEG